MSEPTIKVTKLGATSTISCCVLTDMTGVNHCEHAPSTRPVWHRRLRWSIAGWWFEHWPRVHFGPCDHGGCQ